MNPSDSLTNSLTLELNTLKIHLKKRPIMRMGRLSTLINQLLSKRGTATHMTKHIYGNPQLMTHTSTFLSFLLLLIPTLQTVSALTTLMGKK